LGLKDAVADIADRAEAVDLRDYKDGKLVCRLDLKAHASDLDFLLVHRADLIQTLFQACKAQGVRFAFSQSLSSQDLLSGAFGREAAASPVDLVIGADGVRSNMRTALLGPSAPFFTGQVAWRALVSNSMDHPNKVMVHMGPGRHIVSYPLRGGSLVNLVMVQERSLWAGEGWSHRDDPAHVRAAFADFGGLAHVLLNALSEVYLWGLFRHPVAECWFQDRSVLIGDAAHPMLPFLAQGANMALEDAWVLSRALHLHGATRQGFQRYQFLRQARVKKVVATAQSNARNYHLSAPLTRWVAHSALRGLGAVAPSAMLKRFDWLYRFNPDTGLS
jgi:salicylate hydroxylase